MTEPRGGSHLGDRTALLLRVTVKLLIAVLRCEQSDNISVLNAINAIVIGS
jgi:hypothetical protein